MGDITDLFSVNARTKVTPTKGYNASFSTGSTTFVDVTSLSVSVPAGASFAVRGQLAASTPTTTTTLQVLLGASVVYTATESSGGGGGASAMIDSFILYNNTGSTQTAKVQVKVDAGGHTGGVTVMSIIQGSFLLPFDSSFYAIREGWQDISSLDFICCLGNGVSNIIFDGVPINDTATSAVTWSGTEKFCNVIRFYSNVASGYVAFDFTGKYLVL